MNDSSSAEPDSGIRVHARRLGANFAWQLVGQLAPLLGAAIALPIVRSHSSPEDFGIFTLCVSALGLFAVLDLGLGRATVRFAARALALADEDGVARTIGASTTIVGGLAVIACALLLGIAPNAVVKWLNSATTGDGELRAVVVMLLMALPAVAVSAVLRSALEAESNFSAISVVQGTTGTLAYLAPAILSVVSVDIRLVVGSAVLFRCLALPIYVVVVRRWIFHPGFSRGMFSLPSREFLTFSAGLIVSNIVGAAIVYVDRALLARHVPLGEVSYYNVPLEFLLRMSVLINAAITVGFPLMTRMSLDNQRFDRAYAKAFPALAAVLSAGLLLVSIAAPNGLSVWLGDDFEARSTMLVRIFLVGFFLLSLNALTMASLVARGISGRIGIMHLLEAPLYIYLLDYFGQLHGMTGMAIVWSARMAAEYVLYTLMQAKASTIPRNVIGASSFAALSCVPLLLMCRDGSAAVGLVLGFLLGVWQILKYIRTEKSG